MKPEIEALKKALSRSSNFPYVIHDDNRICGFKGKYGWLSNFHRCPDGIYYQGLVYPSVEAAFQSCKWPVEDRIQFVNISASEAKKLGKQSTKKPDNWDEIKFDIMAELVKIKFTTDVNLKQKLIDTGTKYLEETNDWYDFGWGVCNGKGENKLGKILMATREFIKTTVC
jgi:ribA/ribD-fused uncharacterized protein